MLSRVFYCQWMDKKEHDWTEQVRADLEDFRLPVDLAYIEKKSVFSWKNTVKKRAKEYEFDKMIEKKETKNQSKLKPLSYEKLEQQEYLKNLDVKLAKTSFRFRTRMAQFGGNFKGQGPLDPCPLCGEHQDLQELSFQCPEVLDKIKVNEDYDNIFEPKISRELAKNLQKSPICPT